METLKTLAFWVFVACVPLLLITTNLRFIVCETHFYQYEFNKRDISRKTGISDADLIKTARTLINYFNAKEDSPQIQVAKYDQTSALFNQREIEHLKDVRGLIQLSYIIQGITLAYVIIYIVAGFIARRRVSLRQITRGIFLSGVFTLTLLAFLGIWSLIDFDSLFRAFHMVSFQNTLYYLDPSRDYLIMIFPEGFFSDVALFLFGATAIEALISGGVSWAYLRRKADELV